MPSPQKLYRGFAGALQEANRLFATPMREAAEYYARRRAAEKDAAPMVEEVTVPAGVGREYMLSLPRDPHNFLQIGAIPAVELRPSMVLDRRPIEFMPETPTMYHGGTYRRGARVESPLYLANTARFADRYAGRRSGDRVLALKPVARNTAPPDVLLDLARKYVPENEDYAPTWALDAGIHDEGSVASLIQALRNLGFDSARGSENVTVMLPGTRAYAQGGAVPATARYDAPPVAGVFGPTVIPRQTLSDRLDQLSYGLGTGFVNQMQGYRQMLTHPLRSVQELAQAVTAVAKDPRLAADAMYGMWNKAASGPEGFGQVVGENLSPRQLVMNLARKPVMQEITTYHGTPHVFAPEEGAPLGRFRSSQIGTGEGAQVYGHGLYLAENPDVAGSYVSAGGSATKIADKYAADIVGMFGGEEKAIKHLNDILPPVGTTTFGGESREMIQNALDSIKSGKYKQHKGSLYTVDLPDPMIERMLDWDKPLKEQPQYVREALTRLARDAAQSDEQLMKEFQRLGASAPANQLYALLTERAVRLKKYEGMRAGIPEEKAMPSLTYGQQIASEQLRKAGIPGIKYLDAGSRSGDKGTRNFVVFPGEEQNLTILERK